MQCAGGPAPEQKPIPILECLKYRQAWAANVYSLIGDLFPKSTIATLTGMCSLAGGISTMALQKIAGNLFTYAEQAGSAFRFLGFEGKPAGYFIIFCYCGLAYLLSWVIMKALVPVYKPVTQRSYSSYRR